MAKEIGEARIRGVSGPVQHPLFRIIFWGTNLEVQIQAWELESKLVVGFGYVPK